MITIGIGKPNSRARPPILNPPVRSRVSFDMVAFLWKIAPP